MDFDSFVLCASSSDLREEPTAREHADAVEFRMDLADDPLAALDDYDGELPILATNRVAWEGGEAADDAGRLDDLAAAAEFDAVEAIDVELAAVQTADVVLAVGDGGPSADAPGAAHDASRVVEHARDHGVSVVVSAHDFDGTPAAEDIAEMLDAACEVGDVGKVAVTATEPLDVLSLLAVTREFDAEGDCVATMAMGTIGSHSRVVAPAYGSRIGYAPVDPAKATAPGQLDLETMGRALDDLSAKPERY
ncbi:type I 3-dehydroquinate dehydratase [Haloarchaeobius sp. DFWS5]|uniref:type I 3-dehydroquinate dehydratase n=1 Tax=Haloarchaeobius sp. DFWS5 TaxID=3446114 RepID=UPI003EBDFC20